MDPALSVVVFVAMNVEVVVFVAFVVTAVAAMVRFAKWFDEQLQ